MPNHQLEWVQGQARPATATMSSADGNELFPIALLIDELKNDDVTLRLNSVRRLKTIASALGEERTRQELIPFLTESNDDEDEVLLALAEELGGFTPFVGGPSHAHCLLVPLEALCTVEETVVRDKAVESLRTVAAELPSGSVTDHFIPLIRGLASAEWFTSRVSSCGLFAAAYPLAPAAQQVELRQLFCGLSGDETPMVRRAAAQNLGKFAEVVEPEAVASDLLPTFEKLASDDQDSVRLLTVEGAAPLMRLLRAQQEGSDLAAASAESVLANVQKLAQDKSWRVRYSVAQNVPALVEAMGPEAARNTFASSYVKLLQDAEAEVRVAASATIATIAEVLPQEQVVASVLPCVKELSSDTSQFVRAAVASAVMQLAPLMGKAATLEHLLPVLLSLLRDSFPEVRLNIIGKLDQVNQVMGIDLLAQSLLPAIQDLAEDKHWRVRLAIIECVPLLAAQMGSSFFEEKLGVQCFKWLEDTVFSIREAATQNLERLAKEFGPEWAKEHLVPKVVSKATNPHYLYRMTILAAVDQLAGAVPQDTLCSALLPVVVNCAKDKVPNVRFKAAKVLGKFKPLVEPVVLDSSIRPCLESLAEDPDVDVRYYAAQSLAACDGDVEMTSS